MSDLVPIEGTNLVRDVDSFAVLNGSEQEYDNYMKGHQIRQKNLNRVAQLEQTVLELQATIKSLLESKTK